MSDIPLFTPQEIIKILKKRGFVLDRVKGSHHIYYHEELRKRVIDPLHKRDIPEVTFYQIIKEAGIVRRELKK